MKSLIELAVAISMMAFAAGNLPKIVKAARKAQIYLLLESKSSNWGKPWTPD
jgi:hypothetical protein